MTSQLSKNDIELLYQFVRKKYVRYKDVQFELVDHLASGIEEQQLLFPGLSFQQALDKVYAEFPVTGFAKLIEAKSKALTKYWYKRIFRFMIQFVSWPRAVLTLILTISLFNLIYWYSEMGMKICMILVGILIVGMLIKQSFFSYKHEKRVEEYLIVKTYYSAIQTIVILMYIGTEFLTAKVILANSFTIALFAFFMVTSCIFVYGLLFSFPQMLKEEIESKYAHLIRT